MEMTELAPGVAMGVQYETPSQALVQSLVLKNGSINFLKKVLFTLAHNFFPVNLHKTLLLNCGMNDLIKETWFFD